MNHAITSGDVLIGLAVIVVTGGVLYAIFSVLAAMNSDI